MSITAKVLFDMPQSEIASLLETELRASVVASMVTGFATVEGVRAIKAPISINPSLVDTFVVGAATYQAFEGLDRLIMAGVPSDRLYVHLGHTRLTSSGAKHKFYRYHPMLHSKVYYMEQRDGTASAIIGSHNITGFALGGLNGEAAVLLKGPKGSPEFIDIREHIRNARDQAVSYRPEMKAAYSWWAHQFLEGLRDKANDFPREGEATKTIVVLAELDAGANIPQKNDTIYFELPSALGTIQSLRAEVHVYLFDKLPSSVWAALRSLKSARSSVWCRAHGLELERGGVELQADWRITDHAHPILKPVRPPFRPRPASDMQQVRVKAYNEVRGEFEYLFELPPAGWIPVLDKEGVLRPSTAIADEATGYRSPNPENREWYRVVGLTREDDAHSESSRYKRALVQLSPDGGSYVIMSMRRRELRTTEKKEDTEE